jgi:hypothetical protein
MCELVRILIYNKLLKGVDFNHLKDTIENIDEVFECPGMSS